MAVTTTYDFTFVTPLNPNAITSDADVTRLTGGGVAVAGTNTTQYDVTIFGPAGNFTGASGSHLGTASAISQLSNSNIVSVGTDGSEIFYTITDSVGASVVASTGITETDSSSPDVAGGLTGGRFVIVYQDLFAGSNDIDFNIRNNDGTSFSYLSIANSGADDRRPSVAALADGGFAVAWHRVVGAETELFYAVYEGDGTVRLAATLLDTTGTINQNASVVALASGGFGIAYEDNGWSAGDTDITFARFNAAGSFIDWDDVSQNTTADTMASITALSNGMVVVGSTSAAGPNTDPVWTLVDQNTGGRLTSSSLGATGNNDTETSVAGMTLGQVAVFFTDTAAGDVVGQVLQGRRLSTGDGGNDIITGDDLVDIANGGGGSDTIAGGGNNDTINAGAGNDTVDAGDGDDIITDAESMGSGEDDVYDGGAGTDTLIHDLNWVSSVAFNLNTGFVTYLGNRDQLISIENLTVGGQASVTGSSVANVLTVTGTGNNTIDGLGGNDSITAGGGNDTINAGSGNDTVVAGDGDDTITDTEGMGSGEDDIYDGGAGTDTLIHELNWVSSVAFNLNTGFVTYLGNRDQLISIENLTVGGQASVTGSSVANVLTVTGTGNNTIDGLGGNDTITVGGGNDTINAGSGNDTVIAGDGDDIITDTEGMGAGDDDVYNGGTGTDTLIHDLNWISSAAFNLNTGFATIDGINRDQLISIENVTVGGSASVTGSNVANVLTVNGTGNNTIDGLGGNDTINAGGGNDTINAGAGNDTVIAGADNDTLTDTEIMLAAEDDVFNGGTGIDTLIHDLNWTSSVAFNLDTGFATLSGVNRDQLISIENLTVGGSASVTGSNVGNVLIVNGSGDNTINGLAGNDVINPGGGNDTVDGGADVDTVDYSSTTLGVTVNLSAAIDQATGAEIGTDQLASIENVLGGSGNDTILGNSADNVLTGNGGNDVLEGNLFADTLNGGSDNDTLYAMTAANIDGSGVGDILNGDAGDDTIFGSGGGDTLNGGADNDTLDGRGDNDTINGGSGNDLILPGAGEDTVDGGDGIDTVDYSSTTLGVTVNLSAATNQATGAEIGTDQIANVENVIGGSGADNIIANAAANNLQGGGGADTFRFAPANLNSADTVVGGGGAVNDTLLFTAAGAVTAAALANVSEIENVNLFAGGNTLSLTNAMAASANGGFMRVFGGAGNDVVSAAAVIGAGLSVSFNTAGGNDALTGSSGGDAFSFAFADFNTSDAVNGGTGSDLLSFSTDAAVTLPLLAVIQSIEQVRFLGVVANSLALNTAYMNTVNGGQVVVTGAAGNETVDASTLTNLSHRVQVNMGAGNDVVLGGLGADQVFVTGANLNASDTYTGGLGTANDKLSFTTAAAVTAAQFAGVTQIEVIELIGAGNSLQLTLAMGNSARDNFITVSASAGNDVIDASLLTSAAHKVLITTFGGNDTITGSAGADTFQMNPAELTAADTIQGGGGSDLLRFISAGTITAAALANVSGVETFRLHGAGSNNLTLTAALPASALSNIVSVVGFGGNDTVNAAAVANPAHRVFFSTGAGNDILTGGAGNDNFAFLVAELNGDTVVGGAGLDLLSFTSGGTITAANLANVSGVENITLANASNVLNVPDALVTSAAGSVTINGGSANDNVNASALTGANRVIVFSNGGNDTLTGGAGADQFRFAAATYDASDTVDGNGGNDLLLFTSAGTIAAGAFAGTREVETIQLANGTNSLTLTDLLVSTATLTTLTVNGGTGADTVNGAAVTTAAHRLVLNGNAGNDTLVGGSGNDTLNGGADIDVLTGRAGVDMLTGGTGDDDFVYLATGDSNETAGMDTIADMEAGDQLNLASLFFTTSETAILNKGNAAYVGSTVDFFNDGGTDRAVAVQTNGATTRVYGDSNGDGNYTLGTDLAIQFTGNVLANLVSTGDYIF